MTYSAPAPLPESEQKKTATAVDLAKTPQTCGELYGWSESWSDEMSYLSQDIEKYAKEYAYARYMAERFAYVTVELRKRPEYTSEYRFPEEMIEACMVQFDNEHPEKVADKHLRLPEEIDNMFGQVKEMCQDLNDQLKSGKKIDGKSFIRKFTKTESEWDTGSTYEDDMDALKKYRKKGRDDERSSFVGS